MLYPSDAEIDSRAERVHEILDALPAVRSYVCSDGQSIDEIEQIDGVSNEQIVALINAELKHEFSPRDVYAHVSYDGDVRVQLFEIHAEA